MEFFKKKNNVIKVKRILFLTLILLSCIYSFVYAAEDETPATEPGGGWIFAVVAILSFDKLADSVMGFFGLKAASPMTPSIAKTIAMSEIIRNANSLRKSGGGKSLPQGAASPDGGAGGAASSAALNATNGAGGAATVLNAATGAATGGASGTGGVLGQSTGATTGGSVGGLTGAKAFASSAKAGMGTLGHQSGKGHRMEGFMGKATSVAAGVAGAGMAATGFLLAGGGQSRNCCWYGNG